MQISKEQKAKKARLVGSLYFVVLGLVNAGATLVYGKIAALDFIILALAFLPLLIKKKMFLLIFGLFGALVSLYMGYGCLLFNLNPKVQTPQIAFTMGYLLAAACLLSSLLLIYAGVHSLERDKWNLAQNAR